MWHAFIALAYNSDGGQLFADRVRLEIIDPVNDNTDVAVTKDAVRGLMAGMRGHLEDALTHFRKSLIEATHRDERIRALQFLVLTTSEMGALAASLGYTDELIKYDPGNYLARLWRSDLLESLGDAKEAKVERDEAHRLLETFEDAARMELGHTETFIDVAPQLEGKGDLRAWLENCTSPILAPLRGLLMVDPGTSNLWSFLCDQIFGFDDIFGPSQSLQDAALLEETVASAVKSERLEEPIQLPRAIRHPFAADGTELVTTVVVEKVMASNARPALVLLRDAAGRGLLPRLMWKKGDDLRRDMLAMVFFEVFNVIWKNSLGHDNSEFEPVLTYGVLPLKGHVGFIEWVRG